MSIGTGTLGPDISVTDSGHIFDQADADNWVAIVSTPHAPSFVLVIPLIKWVLVKRNGVEMRDALIPIPGNPNPQLVSQIAEDIFNLGIFFDYANVPLQSHSVFTSSTGRTMFQELRDQAAQQGQRWAEFLKHQQNQSELSEDSN